MFRTIPVREDVFKKIEDFLLAIDKPGAILAVYDEGKIFARAEHLNYQAIYAKMFRFIFENTSHIKVRVGGYSHRVESMVWSIAEKNSSIKKRIEWVGEQTHDIIFDKDSDFIKRADKYDFKGFDGHSCVYYYVNNIESGFTTPDGEFHGFYGAKHKGFDAIVEMVMAIGYGDIPSATAAVHTFSTDSSGDMLICGGKATKKKCRGQSRQDLFEEYGIKYLDIHSILPTEDVLFDDLKKAKDEERRVWFEEHVLIEKDDTYSIVRNQGKFKIKNNEEFLKTPGGQIATTSYMLVAKRLMQDWKNKGYDSYTDPTSMLSYHFTCQERFAPMKKEAILSMLNSLNWENNWTFESCPSPNPHVIMEWKSLLGEPEKRICQIKNWFKKCSHMQLVAATCVYNACYSYNVAYLMAAAVERIKNKDEREAHIRYVMEFLSKFDSFMDPDYMMEIFDIFRIYYGIHFREDGAKTE